MLPPTQGELHYLVQHLRLVIIHSLDHFNYTNAEFAGERLLTLDPRNLELIYLYALLLVHQRKYKLAYNRLYAVVAHADTVTHLGCTYLFARCCLHLEKYKEGVYQLTKGDFLYVGSEKKTTPKQRHEYETHRSIYPDPLVIYHLLGDLYRKLNDVKNSALSYTQALQWNRFDFEAFQQLCKLGVDVKAKAVFDGTLTDTNVFIATDPQEVWHEDAEDSVGDILSPPRANLTFDGVLKRLANSDFPKPKPQFSGRMAPRNLNLANTSFGSITLAPPERSHGPNAPGQASARNFSLKPPMHRLTLVETSLFVTKEIVKAEQTLAKLYLLLGRAFKALCRYDCYKAIRLLELLPDREKDTPWVLAKLGKLHYEIVNYKQLEFFFARLRQVDRTRLEDMEYFSTLLWHLHKKADLTYLANELHDLDPQLPVTWCAIGNLFSLNREPDEAIKALNKATKLDKLFVYAYTLKGHEYFSNDNYEMAFENFRTSLLLDGRHYNAFYGIGMVYMSLGDYQKADYHFRKAVGINPINIILICCVGMVLDKLGKKTLALRQYDLACKLQPLNPLPLFKKAQLLFSLQQFAEALKIFETLKEIAPDEALVHFLLGQLYNIQNDKFSAIREFTIALHLDPKGNYIIKEAMELLKD